MASSFFLLFDDIALLLDDVSVMTKVAAKKTAGVLGDDLALNAHQVSGVNANRELAVVWAVAKGSLLNKVILVPIALLISAFAPSWVIPLLLILGGLFLCYEGVEKVVHTLTHDSKNAQHTTELISAVKNPAIDLSVFERDKIKGAIRTDFILSAEIIVIALGVVAQQALPQQVMVLSAIAGVMTIGVYGLVAMIVKIDDFGLFLLNSKTGTLRALKHAIGHALLKFAPFLMKALSVIGTLAMFLVGGGILTHNIHFLHQFSELAMQWTTSWMPSLVWLMTSLIDLLYGLLSGGCVVLLHVLYLKLTQAKTTTT